MKVKSMNRSVAKLTSLLAALLAMPAVGAAQELLQFPEPLKIPFPQIELSARQSKGQDAVNRLGRHLTDVAQWYGKTADQLRKELLNDPRMRVDQTGRILFVEDLEAPVVAERAAGNTGQIDSGALVSLDQTFYLHSHPGANRTIYLDFTGATVTNSAWNTSSRTITAKPFDIDGNPATFSDEERRRIQYIWQRVAEDYAPFDVDVTTEQPAQATLTRSDVNDKVYGTTIVITNNQGVYDCRCGGIAYVGVFNYSGGNYPPDYYKPAFVFYNMLGNGAEKPVAEAISHEAGHNMGLHHDGNSSDAYYGGQGTDANTGWAPIMGVGYYKPLVQFSKGEYADASNKEDDFVVAQSFGLPIRLDDFGSTLATAAPFIETRTGTLVTGRVDGVIESFKDRDVFSIAAGPGALNATVVPAMRSPNADLVLTLKNAAGQVLATTNPFNQLSSILYYTIPTQGTYYLEVKGTGQGNPSTTGYTSYGSVGNFRLTVNYTAPTGARPTAVMSATPVSGSTPLSVKFSGLSSTDDGKVTRWYWDFGDGNNNVTGTLATVSHVYSVPGNYLARLTVVDNTGLNNTTTKVINASAPAAMTSVQSIQMKWNFNDFRQAWATATITVVNQSGKTVSGATVSASWNGLVSQTVSGKTSTTGVLTLASPKTTATGCIGIKINSITAPSYTFNAASPRTAQICR